MSISKDIGYLKYYACLFLWPKKLLTIIGRQDEKQIEKEESQILKLAVNRLDDTWCVWYFH